MCGGCGTHSVVCYSIGMSENETSKNPYRRATGIAVTVLGLGLAASIAGNIQSILLEDGSHGIGSMISAVWWPFILFLMIEIAIHTPWAKTTMDRVAQWAGAGVIGALAFYISYFHLAHVLSSFGYDVVSRYMGPLAVDTAMMVATYALNRVGVARRALATENEAMAKAKELANVATEMATKLVGQEPATAEPVAMATVAEPDLATDWADLESDFDRELAEMTAAGQAAEEPAQEPAAPPAEAPAVKLTSVKTEAAERILALLADGMEPSDVDEKVAAEFGSSPRSARRWRGALGNGTARVS